MDEHVATPQRLQAGKPIMVKGWQVALASDEMAEFVLRKPHAARQQWAVVVRAACTPSGGAAPVRCSLIVARKGGIPDCALMLGDSTTRKREKIVIECPVSVELEPARG